MESHYFYKKIPFWLGHFPTLLLLIGYPVYWLEMIWRKVPSAQTSLLAVGLFLAAVLSLFFRERLECRQFIREMVSAWRTENRWAKVFLIFGLGLVCLILGCASYEARLPPHLIQEFDALNYHITIPRQHLLTQSFAHLPWSVADLFLLPVNFALAPFWLATPLPNKIPQLVFVLGLLVVGGKLGLFLSRGQWRSFWLIILAFVGSHGLVIQMGTAMLDLVLCYLFLAGLDSLVNRRVFWAALEWSFLIWAKSFLPLQFAAIALLSWLAWRGGKGFFSRGIFLVSENEPWKFDRAILGKGCLFLFVLSLFIGGPFVAKSLYYTGTPLYPIQVGLIPGARLQKEERLWASVKEKAKQHEATRRLYGKGQGPKSFTEHFWILAVPEKDVNNRFDYPLGLPYLLVLGPFVYLGIDALKKNFFPVLVIFVVLYWLSWWLGLQQARFLYIPLVAMMIMVFSIPMFYRRTILLPLISVGLLLSALSIVRAYKSDFGKSAMEVLRPQDQDLLALGQTRPDSREPVVLTRYDVALADFLVDVRDPASGYVFDR